MGIRLRVRPARRRLVHNLAIVVVTAAMVAVVNAVLDADDPVFVVSMATGWAGFALLGATLALGPLNVLTGSPNPVSTHLRRDIGIWAGLISGVHVVVGFERHFGGDWRRYLFGGTWGLRLDAFGLASWAGVVATGVVVVLLLLSNDRSLRQMGAARWKRWQRWNYVVFPTVVGHGLAFQVLSDRSVPWVFALMGAAVAVTAVQALGVRRIRSSPSHR